MVERSIRTVLRLRAQTARNRSFRERLAGGNTNLSGRLPFVYLHAAWFGAWVLLDTGRVGAPPLDPYPCGLLTEIERLRERQVP